MKKHIATVTVLCTVLSSLTVFANSEKNNGGGKLSNIATLCNLMLTKKASGGSSQKISKHDAKLDAMQETHSLDEIFAADSEKNLMIKHPWMAMSAPQRILSLIRDSGVKELFDTEMGSGKIKYYSLFSDGIALADGFRIIGQEHAIEAVVSQIEAAAVGDRSGLYPPLLVGEPGTGKSEFLKILRTALINGTTFNPEHFLYSYEWSDLENIPALADHIPQATAGAGVACPIHDSPITILPGNVQNALTEMAHDAVYAKVKIAPRPKTKPCPQCEFYRKEVIRHYATQKKQSSLSASEIVEALAKHIRIKRVILGDPGTAPLIPKQAKDVDYAGLFVAKNPVEFVNSGPGHPLSYQYNGTILGGNGSAVMLDEVGKNPSDLRGKLLNTIQDRTIQEGGAPQVDIDALFLTATNTKDIEEILAEDPRSPFLDRMVKIPMNWSIRPAEIAKTLSYEYANMQVRLLSAENSEWKPAASFLDEMFPRRAQGKEVQTTDRRFALRVIDAGREIHIAPHTLIFVSQVAALTRMNFDPAKVKDGKKYPVIEEPVYTRPQDRLKAVMGKEITVTPSQAKALWTVSKLTNEGTFGMSARDLTKWLKAAISEASKAENGGCVTPLLLVNVLRDMVIERMIGSTNEDRMNMLNKASIVSNTMTVPELQKDVNQAVSGSQDDTINQIYDDLMGELLALHADKDAKNYVAEGGNKTVAINFRRLAEIQEIYLKEAGRPISVSEITMFHYSRSRHGVVDGNERNQQLIGVITKWQATKVAQAHEATLGKIISIAAGRDHASGDDLDLVSRVTDMLENQLGYCKHCASKALEMLQEQPDGAQPGSNKK